jgi:hypothetical protein
MSGENDPIAAALEAKIAALQAVLDSYRAAIALGGPLPEMAIGTVGAGAMRAPTDLPVGVFRDKTIRDAILIYLGAGRRKQTNKEIADGLKKGGIATTSKNFEPTVATALHRLKNDGIVLRFDDGWDLAASYPDNLRHRLGAKRPKRSRRGKQTAKARAKALTESVAERPDRLRAV